MNINYGLSISPPFDTHSPNPPILKTLLKPISSSAFAANADLWPTAQYRRIFVSSSIFTGFSFEPGLNLNSIKPENKQVV